MPWVDEDSPGTQAAKALVGRIERYAWEHTPPRGTMPDGIRVEMHPAVRYVLLGRYVPGYQDFVQDNYAGPLSRVQIPVKVNPELPRGGWRLVVVTEDVIDGGTVGDG